jgi:hypothetical protein
MSAAAAKKAPTTTIQRKGFVADVILSSSSLGDIYHYVVQREGSTEILHWGQEVSLQRAVESVNEYIDDISKMLG